MPHIVLSMESLFIVSGVPYFLDIHLNMALTDALAIKPVDCFSIFSIMEKQYLYIKVFGGGGQAEKAGKLEETLNFLSYYTIIKP